MNDWNQWSYLTMTHGWQLAGERDRAGQVTFWLHNLTVPDHQTVHEIMVRRGGRARIPLADYNRDRGWVMSFIELTEAEAAAIRDGADPLALLAGPRIRLEIVRDESCFS